MSKMHIFVGISCAQEYFCTLAHVLPHCSYLHWGSQQKSLPPSLRNPHLSLLCQSVRPSPPVMPDVHRRLKSSTNGLNSMHPDHSHCGPAGKKSKIVFFFTLVKFSDSDRFVEIIARVTFLSIPKKLQFQKLLGISVELSERYRCYGGMNSDETKQIIYHRLRLPMQKASLCKEKE